jgi:hypothetical protein
VLVDQPTPTTPAAPQATLDAHNVDRTDRLSVNVSTPASRRHAAAISTLEMGLDTEDSFGMNLTHAAAPETVGAEPYSPPGSRTVLQYIRLTHTIPDDAFDETAVGYRVSKERLPSGTTPVEVVFRRYADSEWVEQPSSLRRETPTHYVYRVETEGFSQFLVTGPETSNADSQPSQPSDGGSETVDYLLAGLLILGMVGSGLLVYRTRQDNGSFDRKL